MAQVAAADVYTWRTEDGGYAYTDDRDQIPARYRAQAKRVPATSLSSYERYTPQDPAATSRYEERLERRLAALRAQNAQPAPQAAVPSDAASSTSLLVGAGSDTQVSVPMTSTGEPVVVEEVLSKRTGDPRTRRSTVVRQGDRVLTVVHGEPHVFDPVDGIADEDALAAGELD
jgi:hypothetical protein